MERLIVAAVNEGSFDGILAAVAAFAPGRGVRDVILQDDLTVLHLCAATSTPALAAQLIASGVNVNAQSLIEGLTALHIAAAAGRLAIVEVLLDCPAIDDTICNFAGLTPAEVTKSKAVENAFRYAQSRFCEHAAAALAAAVQQRDPAALVQVLASSRARSLVDVSALDGGGETVLHRAVRAQSVELVRAALQIGANPFAKNRKGKMAMELATSDDVRLVLKGAPMVPSNRTMDGSCNIAGHLFKYVNFANGYKRRYATLEDGVFSYYRNKEEYPVSCRGSINMQFARLYCPRTDRLALELRTSKYALFFRAESEAEASRWIVALRHWQRTLGTAGEASPPLSEALDALGDQSTSRTSLASAPDDDGRRDLAADQLRHHHHQMLYAKALSAALAAIDQLEAAGAATNGGGAAGQGQPAGPANFGGQMEAMRHFIRVSDEHCRWLRDRLEAAERTHRHMFEESTAGRREEGTALGGVQRHGSRLQSPRALKESLAAADYRDEFYDAVDEVGDAIALLAIPDKDAGASVEQHDDEGEDEDDDDDDDDDDDSFKEVNPDLIVPERPPSALAIEPDRTITEVDEDFIRTALRGYAASRRTRIPVDSSGIPPVSIWGIIKNSIGKDLTRIPFPINFSEPISMLQRLCEDLEYADLLYKASKAADPMMRLQYITAFAISPYSSSDGRLSKPFNPLLGETFEYVSHDEGFRYISEQVSHHPPISACFCESADYKYYAEVVVKTKFWGKSIELIPDGINHVHLKGTGEHFSYRKVTTAVYNIIMGTMWLDHYGTLTVKNHTTGDTCTVEFRPTGWRTVDPKIVEGTAYDSAGVPRYALQGHWNRSLRCRNLDTQEVKDLWGRHPVPSWSSAMYNFTFFTMTLNEITPALAKAICPTDSRLRPDQHDMEAGNFAAANDIKVLLEEKQRAQRRAWLADPAFTYRPQWFERAIDGDTGEPYWRYNETYWDARERGDWTAIPAIFIDDQEVERVRAAAAAGGSAFSTSSSRLTSSSSLANSKSPALTSSSGGSSESSPSATTCSSESPPPTY